MANPTSPGVRYLEQEDLKKKYEQPLRIDRIEMYCKSIKSIGLATNLHIKVEPKDKGIIKVTVSADPQNPKEALEKAVQYIIGEFIKVDCQQKYGGNGISGPRKANKPVDEEKQRNIQSEGECCLPLSEDALRKHDLLINCALRQFRCPSCLSPFWRTVFIHKPLASCKKCKIRLWPLKRDEEFGVGCFICATPTCDNVFYGRCRATDARQCKICSSDVKNPYIHPRFRPPSGPLPHGVRKPRRTATDEPVSKVHDCAGTCISTFVRQWDETTTSESLRSYDPDEDGRYPPRMPTFDCDHDQKEAQCDNDEGSDSDSESSPQEAPDRRRPHKPQPNSQETHDVSD